MRVYNENYEFIILIFITSLQGYVSCGKFMLIHVSHTLFYMIYAVDTSACYLFQILY